LLFSVKRNWVINKLPTEFVASDIELGISNGGMAEWFKAAVLKTADRKVRGFESYSLRQSTLRYSLTFSWGIVVPGQSPGVGDQPVVVEKNLLLDGPVPPTSKLHA
jgi:hypothetical protein